jgi:hypothetical protein
MDKVSDFHVTHLLVSKLKGRKLENQKKKVCIVSFFGMVYKVGDVHVANLVK